jgi:hypothetical protein
VAGAGITPAGNDDDGDHEDKEWVLVGLAGGSGGLWAAVVKTQTTYFPFVYRKTGITIFAIITV